MKTIDLTVNGEPCSARVTDRTQLAELLRDHLHLTGTHLGCEHGVCGACTVLLDGKPIRSCITYAHACESANVVTVEGLGDDPTGRALRTTILDCMLLRVRGSAAGYSIGLPEQKYIRPDRPAMAQSANLRATRGRGL